ncbi:Transducin/WD40 repeat-like superfamily protein [Euphorbia peplus]|nr:Transducin/WD40 repeat-like superfamily protein [Euphorbia peplus]
MLQSLSVAYLLLLVVIIQFVFWDASSGLLHCTYRAYDNVDEITAAFSMAFNPGGTKEKAFGCVYFGSGSHLCILVWKMSLVMNTVLRCGLSPALQQRRLELRSIMTISTVSEIFTFTALAC